MKTHKLELTTIEVVYENGVVETLTMTPVEFAGLKRSYKWKRRISFKKLCQITVLTKTP